MLNLSCPICNNPIFKNIDGLKFCPICNREVILVDEESNLYKKKKNPKKEIMKDLLFDEDIFAGLKNIIIEKIEFFSQTLKEETQISLIDNYINIILKFLKLLHKINSKD